MQCPLFDMCNCKTAVCRVMLPDEACYWFRWFEKRIRESRHKNKKDTIGGHMRVYVVFKQVEQDEFVNRYGECAQPIMEIISIHASYDDAKKTRDSYQAKNHDDDTMYEIRVWAIE